MAFNMIKYSPTVPALLKSVTTVEDVTVGGTLTCDKLVVTDDTRTSEGDMVIQQGDLILYESPDVPDPAERVDERKIIFNYGDSGLANGATCEIGMKGGTNGVQGDIIFRTQTGTAVPGSTLEEVMRIKGEDIGIGTSIPSAMLDVAGDLKCETQLISNAYTPGDFCPLAINAPGLLPSTPGQMFFEAGRSSSGANSGLSVLNFNHFIDGLDKFPDETKLGWRIINDTRSTADKFSIDSLEPVGGVTGRGRLWLDFDGISGTTTLGGGLIVDYRPEVPSHYIRPMNDDTWELGASSFRWKDIFSANPVTVTSDRNQKKNISALPDNRGLEFINALTPVKYRFKQGSSNRYHYGLIAQDVESLLASTGDSSGAGNGMVVKQTTMVDDPDWEAPDMPEGELESTYTPPTSPQIEREDYGLRYEELIAPLIKAVQQLSAKNTALEESLATLQQTVDNL